MIKFGLKIIPSLFLFICAETLFAQEYLVTAIPEDLKKGANAIIRFEENNFSQSDLNNATEKITRVITVFNDNGRELASFIASQSRFFELRSFSGEIYLESGKVFKKIGKSDLSTSAYSSDLANDDFYSYYTPTAPSYPFTVKYTYEVKWKNGLAYYPTFAPVPGFDCAVEKSIQTIQIPATMSARFKGNNLAEPPTRGLIAKDSVYTFSCTNFKAISYEPMAPSFSLLTPVIFAAPTNFSFDKISGDLRSWQGVGEFLSKLQEQRTTLPPETVTKLKAMTDSAKDDREKIAILYDYLQKNTRYVSIQLGIGGWQPISAQQVDKTGFGDCKALVNYMKALLSAVDIDSDYAIINTDKKRMFSDFSSLNQANHVVLLVPVKGDSIWLECTSRDLPYGYIHSDMAGHDVLLVKDKQSALRRVPDIPDTHHTETNIISMKLHPDANITSSVKNIYTNHKTENVLRFVLYKPQNERINDLAANLSVNKAQISNIKTDYSKSEQPKVTISFDMAAEKYATITGSRMFVSTNPFRNRWSRSFSATSRKLPLHIQTTINQTDSIRIDLPDGYLIESMPQSSFIVSKFGNFSSHIENSGNSLLLIQKLSVPKGEYPVESYQEIKDFFQKVDSALSGRLVLKKE